LNYLRLAVLCSVAISVAISNPNAKRLFTIFPL